MRILNVKPLNIRFIAALGLVSVLVVGGCGSSGGATAAVKKVSATGTSTCCIVSDANNTHVAYLLSAPSAIGSQGELHVASSDGTDVKVATGVASGSFAFAPKGGPEALIWVALNPGSKDGSMSWLDLSMPGKSPKVLFPNGMRVENITPGLSSSPNWTTPILQQGFFTPSGKYFVVGVLAANVANSPDLHVIDMATGSDVFMRLGGAFDYLEAALPDDTMLFQDSVGGNMGVTGPPPVQTLFWVSLASAGAQPQTIDTRTGFITVSPDNKTAIYTKLDRSFYAWDAMTHQSTKLSSDAIAAAIGGGKVGFISSDHSFHVVGVDGAAIVDVAAANAAADPFSPVFVSTDGADAYWFQSVETQNSRGTLMHVATTAGAAANKVAMQASIVDVRPVAGGLLFLENVDDVGGFGNAVRASRDGMTRTPLASGVPVGGLTPISPPMPIPATTWVCPHLTNGMLNKDRRYIDAAAIEPVGALAITTMTSNNEVKVDATVRAGQFAVSDDEMVLVYVGGAAFDTLANNYFGALKQVPVAMPAMMTPTLLDGVTEVGPVVAKSLFVNAPRASTPGVYFVKLAQ
jgi:hypothetical protein